MGTATKRPACFACLRPEDVRTGLRASDKYEAIRMAGEMLVARGCVEPQYVEAMLEREDVVTTYIGEGVAIPHGIGAAKAMIHSTGLCVLQFPDGVRFDEEKAYLVVGIAGLEEEHLPILQALANRMLEEETFEKIKHSTDPAFIYTQLCDGGEEG
ncbi:MAG: PTS mannitol transporter subunit IIA [Clostridia bacterium]|nr:PTS mannitol transporter subunit IIA [Clostridia bacterium]